MSITENDAEIGALPDGTLLHRYLIDRVIGRGGFGITYRARDVDDEFVAVKEFLPRQLVFRQDGQVVPISDSTRAAFHDGLGRFLKEAKALRRLTTLDATGGSVVRVMTFFEGNGTAYLVMQYLAGQRLDTLFKGHPQGLPDALLDVLARRLLDAVACVHGAGFTHGDIRPANIMLRKDGRPVLIDFGAGRWTSQGRTVTATEIVSEGYAPIEHFTGAGQGPFSDIYALGSTLYEAIGGRPVDAIARHQALLGGMPDPQTPAVEIGEGRYDPKLLRTIDRANAVAPASRPQSVAALVALLDHGDQDEAPPEPALPPVELPATASPPPPPEVATAAPEPVPPPSQAEAPAAPIPANDAAPQRPLPANRRGFGAPLIAGAIIAGAVGAGVWFLRQPADQAPPTQVASVAAVPPAEVVPAAPAPVPEPPAPAATQSTNPVVVETTKPAVAAPVQPVVPKPVKPADAEATKPTVAEPAKPPAAEPAKPVVPEPAKPVVADAAKPPVPEPAKPPVVEPAKAPVAEAAKPPAAPPPKPVVPEPVKPVVAAAAVPPSPEAAKPPGAPPPKPAVPEPVKPVVAAAAVPPNPEAAKPNPPVADAGKPPAAATPDGEPVKPVPVEPPKPIAEPTARPQVATRGPQGPTEATASAQALPDGPVGARLSGPPLVYPQRLKNQERPGSADVVCLISVDGKPSDCTLTDVSGPSPFGEAALAYVRGSTYRPARRGGVPVSEQLKVHVEFGLNG
jgi:TonB family protein